MFPMHNTLSPNTCALLPKQALLFPKQRALLPKLSNFLKRNLALVGAKSFFKLQTLTHHPRIHLGLVSKQPNTVL